MAKDGKKGIVEFRAANGRRNGIAGLRSFIDREKGSFRFRSANDSKTAVVGFRSANDRKTESTRPKIGKTDHRIPIGQRWSERYGWIPTYRRS